MVKGIVLGFAYATGASIAAAAGGRPGKRAFDSAVQKAGWL